MIKLLHTMEVVEIKEKWLWLKMPENSLIKNSSKTLKILSLQVASSALNYHQTDTRKFPSSTQLSFYSAQTLPLHCCNNSLSLVSLISSVLMCIRATYKMIPKNILQNSTQKKIIDTWTTTAKCTENVLKSLTMRTKRANKFTKEFHYTKGAEMLEQSLIFENIFFFRTSTKYL